MCIITVCNPENLNLIKQYSKNLNKPKKVIFYIYIVLLTPLLWHVKNQNLKEWLQSAFCYLNTGLRSAVHNHLREFGFIHV